MTPELLPQYTQQLQTMRADLLAQLRQQRGGEVSRADAAAENRDLAQGDWAQSDALRDLSVALEERELQELNQISAALARISAGDFGSCTDCGADIPDARLQANPVAARCIACQTLVENAQGKVHPHTL